MRVRLTQRDERLLAKLAASRWLTTSQIQRFFFPLASRDAVRKRLRKLAFARHLHSQQPHQMAEALYSVGPKGKLVLKGKGMEVALERGLPKQLQHFIGINDIRIAVECSGSPVIYFFAAWELGRLRWICPVIPDAIFALGNGYRSTFVVEYDRGTETNEQFSRKMQAYERGLDGFLFDAVLIVTDTQGRLETLGRHLRKHTLPAKPLLG